MNKLLEISQTYSSISSQLGPSRSQAKIIFICFLPKQFFSNNCTFSCNVSKACQVLQERSFLLNPFPGPIMITSVITNFCVNKDIFFLIFKKTTQFMHFEHLRLQSRLNRLILENLSVYLSQTMH